MQVRAWGPKIKEVEIVDSILTCVSAAFGASSSLDKNQSPSPSIEGVRDGSPSGTATIPNGHMHGGGRLVIGDQLRASIMVEDRCSSIS